ncbi:FHA domain-containing protein [Demequina sp. NBRC 110053]|uniref:FHA domain-containing protein n=1 Tax=Demequina sp. NBRC 110053 TaxID=1570342 RepID=UPI0009FEDCDD|nr:FHA domain-containing protein [Demequina sp. NBRC 110053]
MAAQCSYCGADLRPNSMFCLACGQLVARRGAEPSRGATRVDRAESTDRPASRGAPGHEHRGADAGAGSPISAPPGVTAPEVAAPGAAPVPQAPVAQPPVAPVPVQPSPDSEPVASSRPHSDGQPAHDGRAQEGGPVYVWVLALDGADHVLSRDVFVGRRPSADADADAIAVDDAGRTISRTHAVLRRSGDLMTVEDLRSANGTKVERGGVTLTCVPGEPVAIGHGDSLLFGQVRATLVARQAT